jgi:hypothetical protein
MWLDVKRIPGERIAASHGGYHLVVDFIRTAISLPNIKMAAPVLRRVDR